MRHRAISPAKRPQCAGQAGFSLLELILVLVILGVVAAVVAQPIASTVEGLLTARTQADTRSELYGTLDRLSQAVRGAGEVACTGGALVVVHDDTERTFSLQEGQLRVAIDGEDAGIVVGSAERPVTDFGCAGADTNDAGVRLYGLDRFYRISISQGQSAVAETYVYNR